MVGYQLNLSSKASWVQNEDAVSSLGRTLVTMSAL